MNKFITAHTKSIKDEDKRIIYAKASDGLVDRDKEIIRVSAWTEQGLKNFMANPVLLLSHNHQDLPIGKVLKLDQERDGLYFEAKIMKGTERADEAWEMIKQIGVCAFSVGFMSHKGKGVIIAMLDPEEKESCLKAGLSVASSVYVHTKVELLEISLVSVPSCPTCLLINYKAGKIKTKGLQDACKDVMVNGGLELRSVDSMRSELRKIEQEIETLRKEWGVVPRTKETIALEKVVDRVIEEGSIKKILGEAIEQTLDNLKKRADKVAAIEEAIDEVIPHRFSDYWRQRTKSKVRENLRKEHRI